MNTLTGKTILVTGGARRIGREISLAIARIGGNVIIHHNNSQTEAESTAQEITAMGNKATIIQADFSNPSLAIKIFQDKILSKSTLYGLVNSAAIFQPENFKDTSLVSWSRHLDINLTMPFLLLLL